MSAVAPRRVLVVLASTTRRGGIVNALLGHAVALARIGHGVTLLVGVEIDGADDARAAGVTVAVDPLLPSLPLSILSGRAVVHRLRARGYDAILHAGGKGRWIVGPGGPGTRVAVSFQNENYRARLRFPIWIAPTDTMARDLGRVAADRGLDREIAVVDNPVLPWRVGVRTPSAETAADRPYTVGLIGELSAHKGLALLIDALADLVASGIDFRLVVAGDGPDRARCEARVAELGLAGRTTFLGWIADPRAFLAGLDTLVVPSSREPFGIVMAEAMANGTPLIATATEGGRHVVTDGVDGLLMPIDDRPALSAALGRLAGDPALRARLARAGLETHARRFSMEAIGRALDRALFPG